MIRAIQFQNKRVGSTFLQKALDSHPAIAGVDEVFVNVARKPGMKKSGFTPYVRSDYNGNPGSYLRKVIWDTYPDQHVIFKLMYNQINFHNGLNGIIEGRKMPVIHLMRRNLVKQVISGQNAAYTHHDPIGVTPDRLFQLVTEADNFNKHWKQRFNDRKKLELYYEDIIGQTFEDGFTYVSESAKIALCDFFEVDGHFCAATKKKNKNDIWVYLPNRKGVEKKFKGTKYEWMVRDD